MAASTVRFEVKDGAGTVLHAFDLPMAKLDATAAPTTAADDAAGYVPGSMWVDVSAGRVYVCTSNATGAAKWVLYGVSPAGLGTAATLDADTDATLAADSDSRLATQKAVKSYVDNLATGVHWKEPVRAASVAAGVLGTDYAAGSVVDGVTLATGDRLLLKDQTAATQNGIYVVQASGAPVRPADADAGAELVAAAVLVREGTLNADRLYVCSSDVITLGTDPVAFVQLGGASVYTAGLGLSLTGNQFNAAGNLGAIASLASPNIVVLTTGGGATTCSISPGTSRIGITGGSGQTGTVTIDVNQANIDVTRLGSSALPTYVVKPGGRLTLSSGVPVTTADVTGATTVYYTPSDHNQITLWDATNSKWFTVVFAETTLPLGTLAAGTNYDVYAYLSGGALALEVLAWSGDTTRAVSVTYQDGRRCKSTDKTRLYLGTFRTTTTTTTEDSDARRFLWNFYNRLSRRLYNTDAAVSWTYNVAAWRPWNNTAANKVEWVLGVSQEPVTLSFTGRMLDATTPNTASYIGIGIDSAAAPTFIANASFAGLAYDLHAVVYARQTTAAGYHYAQLLEYGDTAGPPTFFGGGSQAGLGVFGELNG